MKHLFFITLFSFSFQYSSFSQPLSQKGEASFIDYQKSFPRINEILQRKQDTLEKQFEAKGLKWPPKYIYIRSFKYDSQLEVWVKNEMKDPFKLFKTYRVCALAGTLGPKRMEGDYQVPEGFYYINEFNPKSNYYLSLGINYPNVSDKILSDSLMPGGDIYIHGSCVTVGCIPLTDQQIDELYILAAYARSQGQDFIPVHIFPIRFDVKRSEDYLNTVEKDDPSLKEFASRLENAYDYFEKYKQLPVVCIDDKGGYIIDNAPSKKDIASKSELVKKTKAIHRTRVVTGFTESVHQLPQFPGGNESFAKYLDQLGKQMVAYLPTGTKRVFVQVEFVIDKDGTPVNFKVIKGMNDDDFKEELISRMEKMPNWQPALLNDKPVPRKLIQTVMVGTSE